MSSPANTLPQVTSFKRRTPSTPASPATGLPTASSSAVDGLSSSTSSPSSRLPIGTKPSVHNGQLLVSTGVPSLDSLLGGGLAVGSLTVVEEDTLSSYGHLLLKYFLAEGIAVGHHVASIALHSETASMDLLKSLPHICSPSDDETPGIAAAPPPSSANALQDVLAEEEASSPSSSSSNTATAPSSSQDALKIAWRYQHLPTATATATATAPLAPPTPTASDNIFGHEFDLAKKIAPSALQSAPTHTFVRSDALPASVSLYHQMLQFTQSAAEKFLVASPSSSPATKSILRVAVQSLGSPLWGKDGAANVNSMLSSLHALRGIMRQCYAVCMVTVPAHLFKASPSVQTALRHAGDTVVGIESFAGTPKETHPAFKDYHGAFQIHKLPRLNSMICVMPQSLDQVFKVRRKRFTIEVLHLPPDLSENVSRSREESVDTATAVASKPSGARHGHPHSHSAKAAGSKKIVGCGTTTPEGKPVIDF